MKCDQCNEPVDAWYYSGMFNICKTCFYASTESKEPSRESVQALTNQIVTQVIGQGDWYTPLRELSNLAKNLIAPF